MKKKNENRIILSIENSFNLFSFSVSDGNKFFYIEFFESNVKSERILKIINNIFLEKRIFFKDIDVLVYGRGFANFTDLRILFSIIQSLSLGWKIPVFSVSSINAIASETFSFYKSDNIFIGSFLKNDIFCYKFCDKIDFFLEKNLYSYNVDKISDISFPDYDLLGIINAPNNYINYFRDIKSNLFIKKFIYPKSIYLDTFFRKISFSKNRSSVLHFMPDYILDISYKKYNF